MNEEERVGATGLDGRRHHHGFPRQRAAAPGSNGGLDVGHGEANFPGGCQQADLRELAGGAVFIPAGGAKTQGNIQKARPVEDGTVL